MIGNKLYKKFRLWTEEEDKLIKDNYFKVLKHRHSSHHGSRFPILQIILKNAGYEDRTIPSIKRRAHRLGLKAYTPQRYLVETLCSDCSKVIFVDQKYYFRDKSNRCSNCQEIRNRKWDRENVDRRRNYANHYYKNYWKEKNDRRK